MEVILYVLVAVNTTFHLTFLTVLLYWEAKTTRRNPRIDQPGESRSVTVDKTSANQPATAECLQGLKLTRRETSVACMMLEGLSYHEISTNLGLSVRSIQNHASKTFKKAGASSRRDFERLVKKEALFVNERCGSSRAQR